MLQEYPELAKRALEALIPFLTTYLCEAAMCALVNIETTYRNRLRVANDMKIALSNICPRINELISKRQEQKSHCLFICVVLCRVNCDIPLIPLCHAFTKSFFNERSSSKQLICLIAIVFVLSTFTSFAGCADKGSPSQYL